MMPLLTRQKASNSSSNGIEQQNSAPHTETFTRASLLVDKPGRLGALCHTSLHTRPKALSVSENAAITTSATAPVADPGPELRMSRKARLRAAANRPSHGQPTPLPVFTSEQLAGPADVDCGVTTSRSHPDPDHTQFSSSPEACSALERCSTPDL